MISLKKNCLRKILYKEKLHFLVSFSFEKQLEVRLNDPEQVFDILLKPQKHRYERLNLHQAVVSRNQ